MIAHRRWLLPSSDAACVRQPYRYCCEPVPCATAAQVEPGLEHAAAAIAAPGGTKADFLAEQAASQLAWMRESTWHPEDYQDAALQSSDSPAGLNAAQLPVGPATDQEDTPACKRRRLGGDPACRPSAGPCTTRGMLGYPPPRQQLGKIKVLHWARGWRGAVEMVNTAMVPAALRKGEWPKDSADWREPSLERNTDGEGVAGPLHAASTPVQSERAAEALTERVQSQNLSQKAGAMHGPGRPMKDDSATVYGGPESRAHELLAAVQGASASCEAGPRSGRRARSASTDGVTVEERARDRKRSRDRTLVSDSVRRPVAAQKPATGGSRTARRMLPGFDTATQKQRDIGSQNPAWALMQVVGHCTDVEVTDEFHAW